MAKGRNLTVAQYLTQVIDSSGISQTDIASQLGYPNPNIISMFKQGRTKVPLNKVPDLATVLGLDPIHLMRIVMMEYSPDLWKSLEKILGTGLVSAGERRVVELMREVAGTIDVAPAEGEQAEEFKAQVAKWEKNSRANVIKH